MKDLKIYYMTEVTSEPILRVFDKAIKELANKNGLTFVGSGVEIKTGIRDIHYKGK
jgi:uncharacterized protein YggL (DUF469 family)